MSTHDAFSFDQIARACTLPPELREAVATPQHGPKVKPAEMGHSIKIFRDEEYWSEARHRDCVEGIKYFIDCYTLKELITIVQDEFIDRTEKDHVNFDTDKFFSALDVLEEIAAMEPVEYKTTKQGGE